MSVIKAEVCIATSTNDLCKVYCTVLYCTVLYCTRFFSLTEQRDTPLTLREEKYNPMLYALSIGDTRDSSVFGTKSKRGTVQEINPYFKVW